GGDVLRHVLDDAEGPPRRLRVHEHLVLAARRRRDLGSHAQRRRRRPGLPREEVRVPRRVRHRADGVGQRRVRRSARARGLRADRGRPQGGPRRAARQAAQEAPQGGDLLATAMSDELLFANIDEPGLATLDGYSRGGGYEMLRKALTMEPADVLQEMLDSGVRGRGGAGFAMGKKMSFIPKG